MAIESEIPEKEIIPLEKAKRAVEVTARRLGLLHLAFAKTLVEELGEEKGKQLILKAIKYYATRASERIRESLIAQGLEPTLENYDTAGSDLPQFGMNTEIETVEVESEQRDRVFGCVMAKVWREEGGDELGRLYCLVDTAKYMAFDPNFKMIHLKVMPDGDDYCEIAVRPTTEKEREDFAAHNEDWSYIDK